MKTFGIEDWIRWQQQGCTRLPAVVVCRGETLPPTWEGFTDASATALLESAQAGRYSYLCDRPARVIVGRADGAEIRSADGATQLEWRAGKPLDVLHAIFTEQKTPRLPDWPAMTGGMIGVFGYDLVHTWERLPFSAERHLALPLYAMIETRELFIYDHAEQTLGIVAWCDIASDESALTEKFRTSQQASLNAHGRWRSGVGRVIPNPPGLVVARKPERRVKDNPPYRLQTAPDAREIEPPAPSFTSEGFQTAVRRAQDYIGAGHTYQVNLSLRTSRAVSLPAETIYESLRRVNPSPYMGLLRLPEFALVCGSPELLVRLVDGVVSSRPIAGTRPRGEAPPQDSHFSVELLASEKERAEHLMLVDLIRNDIGRVAAFGSVRVPEFMVLERYSHVMHLVSQVEGRLAAGRTWVEVLQSMFPGGTITGCPKIRTMEIIEELEPVGRGFYTGALGWISYGGEMEMNIVIRSMLVQNGLAHVQAGAGIVADSRPERELDEALRKAQALWVALDEAEAAAKPHG